VEGKEIEMPGARLVCHKKILRIPCTRYQGLKLHVSSIFEKELQHVNKFFLEVPRTAFVKLNFFSIFCVLHYVTDVTSARNSRL